MPSFSANGDLYGRPEPREAGLEAIGLWLLAGSYSAAQRSDGFIPEGWVKRQRRWRPLTARLVRAGLWEERASGWQSVGKRQFWKIVLSDRPSIPDALRFAVYARDGYACLHCGVTEPLSLDHIWPWSKGGQDTYENLQTLCRSCNSKKGAKVPV